MSYNMENKEGEKAILTRSGAAASRLLQNSKAPITYVFLRPPTGILRLEEVAKYGVSWQKERYKQNRTQCSMYIRGHQKKPCVVLAPPIDGKK